MEERTDMKDRPVGLRESLAGLRSGGAGIRPHSLRPGRTVYMLAYAIELMLYAVRQIWLPVDETLFGLPGKTVIYVAHMLASLLVMLLWSKRFQGLLRASVAALAAGFLLLIFVPAGGKAHLFSGVLAMGGLGAAVTCARCGFAFAANNAERMTGMLLMTAAVALIYLLDAFGVSGLAVTHLLPLVLVAALAFCLLKYREEDLEAKEVSGQEDARSLYCALAFFIVYFGMDGYLYKLLDPASLGGNILFSLGMLGAAGLFFLVLAVWKRSIWHLWTLCFAFASAAAVLAMLAPGIGTVLPYHLAAGLGILGWPLCMYLLACAQRRFASYRLLKKCTVIFVVLSPLTTLTDDLVKSYCPEAVPALALAYILLMLLLFLLTVPYTYRHLFSVGWISELSREDMDLTREEQESGRAEENEKAGEKEDIFAGYELTPRQREVALLLLAARTRRQIAGELGVSESTVKMHTSDLYRKLGINSRAELFRRFGVSEDREES